MTNETYEKLRDRFRAVFDAKWDRSELDNFDDLREKFAFHMADIATNLQRLADAYTATDCDTPCLANQTELFFVDCVPHLMAAGQIYDEIPQRFDEQNGVHDWDSFVDEEVAK
jgi:hypothetical protein